MSNHMMEAVAAAILGGKEQQPRPIAGPSRSGMKQPPRKFLTCMQKVWKGFNLLQIWSVGLCTCKVNKSAFVNCVGSESLLRLCMKWAEPDVAAADLTSPEDWTSAVGNENSFIRFLGETQVLSLDNLTKLQEMKLENGKPYEFVCPADASESEYGKRKADTMNPKMEGIMKKRTLILGEEEESEDDQMSPQAAGGSESGLKSGASLCDKVETKSPVTEVEYPLKENKVPPECFSPEDPEKEADHKENHVPQEVVHEADHKENHVPQEVVHEADPKENHVLQEAVTEANPKESPFPSLFPASLDELASFLKEAGYKTRDEVRDFAACCDESQESYFNCLVQKAHCDKRMQPFIQHIKDIRHLGQSEWYFGIDHEYVEDLADFMWYIMPGTEHPKDGVGSAAKLATTSRPKAKHTSSSSTKQPKAKARNAKAVEKSESKDKADCVLPAQHAEMEPSAELPGQDAGIPNKYEENKALLQAYRPEWSFLESAENKKLLACTRLRVQL